MGGYCNYWNYRGGPFYLSETSREVNVIYPRIIKVKEREKNSVRNQIPLSRQKFKIVPSHFYNFERGYSNRLS